MLLSLLSESGYEAIDGGTVRYDEAAITDAITRLADTSDVLLTSGAVSVGDYDFVKVVLDRIATKRGGVSLWAQVAIKPAKRLAFAMLGAVPAFGLPGNPVSSRVSFELFACPALRKLAGRSDPVAVARSRGECVGPRTPARREAAPRSRAHHDRGRRVFCERAGEQASNRPLGPDAVAVVERGPGRWRPPCPTARCSPGRRPARTRSARPRSHPTRSRCSLPSGRRRGSARSTARTGPATDRSSRELAQRGPGEQLEADARRHRVAGQPERRARAPSIANASGLAGLIATCAHATTPPAASSPTVRARPSRSRSRPPTPRRSSAARRTSSTAPCDRVGDRGFVVARRCRRRPASQPDSSSTASSIGRFESRMQAGRERPASRPARRRSRSRRRAGADGTALSVHVEAREHTEVRGREHRARREHRLIPLRGRRRRGARGRPAAADLDDDVGRRRPSCARPSPPRRRRRASARRS